MVQITMQTRKWSLKYIHYAAYCPKSFAHGECGTRSTQPVQRQDGNIHGHATANLMV
jgi:hypothetical protein